MKAWQHFCTITHHKILVMKGCFRVGLYRQGFVSGQSTIKGREVRTTPSVKSLDIRLHGFIIRDAISITMSIGLTMDWANKKD